MKRRDFVMALLTSQAALSSVHAQTGKGLKPTDKRIVAQKKSSVKSRRAWSIPKTIIRHYKLVPIDELKTGDVIGVTLLGEDGNKYLLDDVIYVVMCVIERDEDLI